MLKISLMFLAFIVFFVLTLKLAIILMGRIAGKYVGEKHRAADAIVNTGKVPMEWSDKLKKRIFLLSKTQGSSKKIFGIEKRAKTTVLKKVDHLIDYFKTSPLVEDKETKKILLSELQKARHLWEEKDWKEIIN